MTSTRKKNQPHHSQPDLRRASWLLAPGLATAATQLAELRVSTAGGCSGKPKELCSFFKGVLSLPSSMPHRKPQLPVFPAASVQIFSPQEAHSQLRWLYKQAKMSRLPRRKQ